MLLYSRVFFSPTLLQVTDMLMVGITLGIVFGMLTLLVLIKCVATRKRGGAIGVSGSNCCPRARRHHHQRKGVLASSSGIGSHGMNASTGFHIKKRRTRSGLIIKTLRR